MIFNVKSQSTVWKDGCELLK